MVYRIVYHMLALPFIAKELKEVVQSIGPMKSNHHGLRFASIGDLLHCGL